MACLLNFLSTIVRYNVNRFGTVCAVLSQTFLKCFMHAPRFNRQNPMHNLSILVRAFAILLLLVTFAVTGSAQTRRAGEFTFTGPKLDTSEGDLSSILTVTRKLGWDGKMLVDVILVPSTNNAAVTTVAATNTLVFNDFQASAQLIVPVKDDFVTNANRVITFALSNPRPADGEESTLLPVLGAAKTAALNVVDNDDKFAFYLSQAVYYASESDDFVRIYIRLVEPPGEAEEVTVDYQTDVGGATLAGNDLAQDGGDFTSTAGTVSFGPEDSEVSVDIPITLDRSLEFNEEFIVSLSNAKGKLTVAETNVTNYKMGKVSFSRIVIVNDGGVDADQAVGAVDPSFNADNDSETNPPLNQTPGANNTVLSVVVGLNDTTIVGGLFTSYNSSPRSGVARVKSNGELDEAFAPSGGANDFVAAVSCYLEGANSGRVIVAGGFTSMSGIQRNSIARLLENGMTDMSFDPGTGANGPIYALEVDIEGKILIGGDFTSFDGVPRNRIARLLTNGNLDLSFDPGSGANDAVFAISSSGSSSTNYVIADPVGGGDREYRTNIVTPATAGKISLQYGFGAQAGSLQIYYQTVLLFSAGPMTTAIITTNTDGSFSTNETLLSTNIAFQGNSKSLNFVVNAGVTNNSATYNILLDIQPISQNPITIAGDFTSVGGFPASRIARVGNDGSFDPSFDAGLGADSTIYALQQDKRGRLLVGGAFQMFNSIVQRGLVRLMNDGIMDRDFVTGTGPNDTVSSISIQADGRIFIAGRFITYNTVRRLNVARVYENGTLDTSFLDTAYNQYAGFPNPDGFAPIGVVNTIAIDSNENLMVGGSFSHVGGGLTRTNTHPRSNLARLVGGEGRAPGNVQFATKHYGVDEGGGSLVTALERTNGDLGSMGTILSTRDGAALTGLDYTGVTNIATWLPVIDNNDLITGDSRSLIPLIKILDDKIIEGDENLELLLSAPVGLILLGGEYIPTLPALGDYPRANAVILDNDFGSTLVNFSATSYDLDENTGQVTINVFRSGNLSAMVSVKYATTSATNTGSATAGADYTAVSGSLTFSGGQTNKSFTIQVRDDQTVELDEVVKLTLSSPSPGTTIGTNNTVLLTIIDNDYAPGRVGFGVPTVVVSELAKKASVTVKRLGGNVGVITVGYGVASDTAMPVEDYTEVSGTLTWNDQDTTPRVIEIPITNDGFVEAPEKFLLYLTNSFPAEAIGSRSTNVVTIQDDDNFGRLTLTVAQYLADENGTNAVITVIRRDGSAESVSVDYATSTNKANSAIPDVDYVHASGTLLFGPQEMSKSFVIPILDDSVADGERLVAIKLSNPTNAILGVLTNATLLIVDNESKNIPAGSVDTDFAITGGASDAINSLILQPDGKLLAAGEFILMNRQNRQHVARENTDGSLDMSFAEGLVVDGSVRSMVLQSTNNKVYIMGSFSMVNDFPYKYLARLTSAGALDTTFNPGSGPDNPVHSAAETFVDGQRKLLIGGAFTVYNGIARRGIARVNDNGSTDKAFDPGAGIDGTIYSIVVQRDGKILIGGDFTSVDSEPRNSLARLNSDGSLDTTFDPGLGLESAVRTIVLDFDDTILIGGVFSSIQGKTKHSVARIKPDGMLETKFDVGIGANGPIYALALQQDGKILAGGDFTEFGDYLSSRITRLNSDGSSDPTINFGSGANGFIASIAVQADRQILIGGGFTDFDGSPRKHLARIYGGSTTGSGSLEFLIPAYTVLEYQTNAVVIVRRTGGLSGVVGVTLAMEPITAEPGVDYLDISTNLVFGTGESFKKVWIPVVNDNIAEPDKKLRLVLTNFTGGVLSGNQPFSVVTVVSEDSIIQFSEASYSVNETAVGSRATVSIRREGVTALPVSVTFRTQDGTATAGSDYTAVNTTVVFDVGQTMAVASVPIIDDFSDEGNETIVLILSAGGSGAEIPQPMATLTISDNDYEPGVLSLSPAVSVSEGDGSATVTVSRTGGRAGVVGIEYWTNDGSANSGFDYSPVSGTLLFLDGELTKTVKIPINQDTKIEGNETVSISINNATGGASLGSVVTTTITINDDDFGPGSFDTSFSVPGGIKGAAATVRTLRLLENGKLLIGGSFNSVGGSTRNNHARLLTNGVIDSTYSSGAGIGSVNGTTLSSSGKIYFGYNTGSYVGLAMANGTIDTVFNQNVGLNGPVYAVLPQADGKLIVGGSYSQPASGLIRLDRNGELDISFNPDGGIGGSIQVLVPSENGSFYAGGTFSSVGGLPRSGLVRILPTGLLDNTFFTGLTGNGSVNCVLPLPDGKLLVAGEFTKFNGVNRTRLVRITQSGKVDTEFNPASANGTIRALALAPNGKLYIAGDFTSVSGEARVRVALLNVDGSLDIGFDPGQGPDGTVYDLALQSDGQLLLAGSFAKVNGFASPGLARVNGERQKANAPVVTIEYAIEERDGLLYNRIRLLITSEIGREYTLEYSNDLTSWQPLTVKVAEETTTEILDSTEYNVGMRYYRVSVQ